MAKDGTLRGGRRPRSGQKAASLIDKTAAGKDAKVVTFAEPPIGRDFDAGPDLGPVETPKPADYLSAKQADGIFLAGKIFDETVQWIQDRGCGELINPRLVESYANAFARFIQCSEAVSRYGFIAKHPTTGAPIASPFTQLEQSYQKQAFTLWNDIWQTIKENSLTAYQDLGRIDPMERLLSGG